MTTPKAPIENDPFPNLPLYSGHARDAVALATVAAPLLKDGHTAKSAVALAYLLLIEAGEYLYQKEAYAVWNSPTLNSSLKSIMKDLNVSDPRSVKTYLEKTIPDPQQSAEIWKKALTGERVFTWSMRRKIIDAQKAAHDKKQRAASEGRKKRSKTF